MQKLGENKQTVAFFCISKLENFSQTVRCMFTCPGIIIILWMNHATFCLCNNYVIITLKPDIAIFLCFKLINKCDLTCDLTV